MNHLRKETIKALEVRRNTVMAERRKSKMQTLGANGDIYGGGSVYGVAPSVNGRNHRNSNAGISVRDVFSDPPVINNRIERAPHVALTASGNLSRPFQGGQINRAFDASHDVISEDELDNNPNDMRLRNVGRSSISWQQEIQPRKRL